MNEALYAEISCVDSTGGTLADILQALKLLRELMDLDPYRRLPALISLLDLLLDDLESALDSLDFRTKRLYKAVEEPAEED